MTFLIAIAFRYHRNPSQAAAVAKNQSYFVNVVAGENLGLDAFHSIPDGIANRTIAGAVNAAGRTLATVNAEDPVAVVAAFGIEQVPDSELAGFLAGLAKAAASTTPASVRSGHEAWWSAFWNRSHIEVSAAGPNDATAFLVTRQFLLQRYLTALQARSPFPIKFVRTKNHHHPYPHPPTSSPFTDTGTTHVRPPRPMCPSDLRASGAVPFRHIVSPLALTSKLNPRGGLPPSFLGRTV